MVIANREGIIELVNVQTEDSFGYQRDELLKKSIEILLPPRFRASHLSLKESFLLATQSSAEQKALELFGLKKDGTEFPIEFSSNPLTTESGEVLVSVSIRDITGRRVIEESLKKTALDLSRANADLEQFAFVASHDLQEPLRMISTYLDLFNKKYQGTFDSEAQSYLQTVMGGAKRMRALIHDLLIFSQSDAVKTSKATAIDCNTLVDEAISDLSLSIKESGALVSHDSLPTVLGNRNLLKEVFQNLLANALKYRGKATPQIHFSSKELAGFWEFSVKDNGIGIASEYADRVFKLFQRLHPQGSYDGSGIGLALCKRVVEAHGGEIRFESKPGKGTTFFFSIPKKLNGHR
jgi:PAS domain S-box-containing protein